MSQGYDCQACGACCFTHDEEQEGYVPLTRGEAARMRRLGLPVVDEGGPGWDRLGTVPYLGMGDVPVCAAFEGELGGCGCSIYGSRPGACRRFAPGSRDCERAREAFCMDEASAEEAGRPPKGEE